jgi:YihY family inner membrane protein
LGYRHNVLSGVRNAADKFQQRHVWLAFPYGVLKKFGEDRGGQQAALLAYYGFFSLFPLMLVAVTLLAMVLRNNPELQGRILDSALTQFPIIGTEIKKNIHGIAKGGAGLWIGIAGALWGGLGGFKAMQNVMDNVWDIPVRRRANTIRQIVRALMMLAVFGVFAAASTGLAGLGTATERLQIAGKLLLLLLATAVNVGLFLLIFKLLTVADVTWRDVLPGAIVAGVGWALLQALGNYLVGRQLRTASELYGFFGIVLGLLSWMYLGAELMVYAAEINVVKKLHAWPRSLSNDNLTEADRRILARHAEAEERVEQEDVVASFNGDNGSRSESRVKPDR